MNVDVVDYDSLGIFFKHLNYKQWYGLKSAISYTLAYRFTGLGHMEISVAQCSKRDNYNKKTGRDLAAQRLLKGDCILVQPPRIDGKLFDFQQFLKTLVTKRVLAFTDKKNERQKVKDVT